MIQFSVFLSFTLCLSVSLNAQSSKPPVSYGIDVNFDVPNGLKPGENAPLFIAKDTNGSTVDLKEELENGSVVLIFYRGEWCPVCNRYLSNFQDSLSYVTSAGAKVFAITPEVASSADKMIEKTGATFTVVPDPTEEIMKSFDVLFSVTETYQEKIRTKLKSDIATNNAKDEAHLPVPATYIINQQGVIVYRQFDLDYHKRASVRDILTNIPK
jgi:peroxiredoxin